MSPELYYFMKLEEEASEVIKETSKCALFGMNNKPPGQDVLNKEICHREINDFLACIEVLNERFGFDFKPNQEQIELKKRKMEAYYKLSCLSVHID
ncbi:hypothetical protein [Flavobacterium sp.]|jgi:hypothetical protein|uniref:hypothetical protein n=1 Tax=Flavobacterium sp. TaxID=239 RepID=UPI0037BF86DF